RRPLIVRTDRAAIERQDDRNGQHQKFLQKRQHQVASFFGSPGFVESGCFVGGVPAGGLGKIGSIFAPSRTSSVGFDTIVSLPSKPATISISLPSSRPSPTFLNGKIG